MASVTLERVTVPGEDAPRLRACSLEVADGEILAVLGPSGAGKTTVLRAVAGLDSVGTGRVLVGGREVTDVPTRDRNLAMVFQQGGLMDHADVRSNLGFPLRIRRMGRAEIRNRVTAEARALDLEQLLGRPAAGLSEGERSRVATARALVRTSAALLLDEPFALLDPHQRNHARRQLATLQRGLEATVLLATNDQRDALALADRIAVLRAGRVLQVGAPSTLLERPDTAFVAGFLGDPPMSLLTAPTARSGGRLRIAAGALRVTTANRRVVAAVSGPVGLGVRPEAVRPTSDAPGSWIRVEATVRRLEQRGGTTVVVVGQTPETQLTAVVDPPGPRSGERVHLAVDPARIHLFDARTGAALAHGL